MRFVIVSGMSGAGKTTALKMLEDAGYFCVDNLPIPLIPNFADITYSHETKIDNIAVGIDIRSGESLLMLADQLDALENRGMKYEILFLDASDEILIKRYKETRRSHPLAKGARIETGILLEREKIKFLRKKASYIIDTSCLLTRELKHELEKIFVENKSYSSFIVTILSFGFKYGIPNDSDLVFDVRFLPNPYYIPEIRHLTGNDKPIQEYVMKSEKAYEFLDKIEDLLEFLIPNYMNEGKNQLVVSIGCTGGKHRSVTLVNELVERLQGLPYSIRLEHRDIEKDAKKKAIE
ncbi:MAG: RNase adapter RapZ [Firmicutes bacterium]|uniref:RNase adapter RapZ n=1 Tax=Candidatus Scybalomonas excrementavium TaxID=2840943 RepID=A0A9D9I1Q8_9FIRM|nr:RNase adapter RapZ [Candidatus Scybalomonas excrementavium]